jgi:hypothetical protein
MHNFIQENTIKNRKNSVSILIYKTLLFKYRVSQIKQMPAAGVLDRTQDPTYMKCNHRQLSPKVLIRR